MYTCFVYLRPFCVTLDFKLFIDSIHILFLLYLLLWFWDFTIKNLQDFIKIYRALIKDIFLGMFLLMACTDDPLTAPLCNVRKKGGGVPLHPPRDEYTPCNHCV